MSLAYLSVCSGIEAASVALHPLGWTPLAFSEIERFPSAVLAHHYPDVPNLGDMTTYANWPALRPDLLVGGTPCQSFSVAGLRKGLADPRGNLALVFLGLVDRFRPRWVVWENVPGVRSADGGGALGSFLGGLAELGYGWAYRSLDAQYFGLAQRRERVFVVGHSGGWGPPAAVLFEPESLRGDSPPRREAWERNANAITERTDRGGGNSEGQRLIAYTLRGQANASHRADTDTCIPEIVPQAISAKWSKGSSGPGGDEVANLVTHALRADDFDASEDGTGRGTPLIPFDTTQISSKANRSHPKAGDPCHPLAEENQAYTLEARNKVQAVAFGWQNSSSQGDSVSEQLSPSLDKSKVPAVAHLTRSAVRRLTPRECEFLQGFPAGYTQVPYRGKPAADGPRYKALGNSFAVPVLRWIGQRIQRVDELLREPAS